MISSVIVKQLTSVKFVKVEINTVTGKMVLKRAEYNLPFHRLISLCIS